MTYDDKSEVALTAGGEAPEQRHENDDSSNDTDDDGRRVKQWCEACIFTDITEPIWPRVHQVPAADPQQHGSH